MALAAILLTTFTQILVLKSEIECIETLFLSLDWAKMLILSLSAIFQKQTWAELEKSQTRVQVMQKILSMLHISSELQYDTGRPMSFLTKIRPSDIQVRVLLG